MPRLELKRFGPLCACLVVTSAALSPAATETPRELAASSAVMACQMVGWVGSIVAMSLLFYFAIFLHSSAQLSQAVTHSWQAW